MCATEKGTGAVRTAGSRGIVSVFMSGSCTGYA